jgi:hypothetical protein
VKRNNLMIALATAAVTPATGLALAAELPIGDTKPAHSAAWRHDHNRLLGQNVRLTRRLHGDKAARRALRAHSGWTNRHLSAANARLRRQFEARAASQVAVPAVLERIAQCESGGNPRAVDSSGTYRGKYQFDYQTWQANGGSGDPAAASEAEQDRMAYKLYQRRGTSPWPVCGR